MKGTRSSMVKRQPQASGYPREPIAYTEPYGETQDGGYMPGPQTGSAYTN